MVSKVKWANRMEWVCRQWWFDERRIISKEKIAQLPDQAWNRSGISRNSQNKLRFEQSSNCKPLETFSLELAFSDQQLTLENNSKALSTDPCRFECIRMECSGAIRLLHFGWHSILSHKATQEFIVVRPKLRVVFSARFPFRRGMATFESESQTNVKVMSSRWRGSFLLSIVVSSQRECGRPKIAVSSFCCCFLLSNAKTKR